MGAAAREEIEPHPEDVTEVLCAVSARLDTLVRRRAAHDAAARGPPPRPESSEYLAQAAPARQIPGTVSLHGVPWAAKGALQRFDPRAGAHTQASSAPSLSAPFRRASSCDAASRASTELGSRSAEGALASRRRVEAPPTLCLRTGAESASDPASRALRSRGCPQDGAPVSGERSASQALSSASAAAALVSAVLSLFGVLLSAASSILAPLCSSRPPWWSCESPQRPARQGLEGEGRAPVSPLFPRCFSSEALDCLLSDDVGCVY